MSSSSDLMALQRNVAFLYFMRDILHIWKKDSTCRLLVHGYNIICKLKHKVFKVKCVSPEYFDYLQSANKYKINFEGDIRSCALLGVNSLEILSLPNKSWLKLQKYKTESSKTECTKSKKMNLKTNMRYAKEEYFIQCFAVSSIQEGGVLYVTNEKYFDILQSFNISIGWGESIDILIEPTECEGSPGTAESLVLGYIRCGISRAKINCEKILEMYFKTPKLLNKSQVFQINIQKMLPHFHNSVEHVNVKNISFKVVDITGSSENSKDDFGYYVCDKLTKITLASNRNSYIPQEYKKFVYIRDKTCYEIPICPGGLDQYFMRLRELFNIFLNEGESHVKPMILLHGPRGSGKKTVLKCVASRLGLNLHSVNCFDYIKLDGTAFESKFGDIVTNVAQMAPSILYLENIHLVGRDETYKEDVTVVDIFHKIINHSLGGNRMYPVIVVASCSQKIPELIPSIERMFIQTISFKPMRKNKAEELLKWLVEEAGMTCFQNVVTAVAERVNGYLFGDIVKLIRMALKYQREDETLTKEMRLCLTMDHMEKAIGVMERYYSDSIGSAKVPSVRWEDVGGLEKLKEEITLSLNFSTNHPELAMLELRPSGFLFYGPPGTGKTLMAKAVATEFNCSFLSVKGPELMNMYVGQSERNVREVFERAREAAPCVIFFDELDSLAPKRGRDPNVVMDRIVSQLLTEMDGLESNDGVFVIGATNRPDLVDSGLLRPGRFDKMFYVGICSNKEMKLSVIKALTRRFSLDDDVDLEAVVDKLPSHVTGADVYSICSNSWLEAARRHVQKINEGKKVELPVTVCLKDFEKALTTFVPSLTPEIVQSYEKFKEMER